MGEWLGLHFMDRHNRGQISNWPTAKQREVLCLVSYRCTFGAALNTFERGPMALLRRASGTFFCLALIFLSGVAAPLRAQGPRPATFLADHYDVSASLDAIGQSISATAKIDFKAVEASSSVRV